MSDPSTTPTRAQDAIGGEIQEILFSSVNWKQGVDFYRKITGEAPDPAGPPTAVLKLKKGGEIHITQTNDKELLSEQTNNRIYFYPVGNPKDVGNAMDIAKGLGAEVIIRSIEMDVFPAKNPPVRRQLTMGIARFKAGPQFTSDDTTVGVVHNPNW